MTRLRIAAVAALLVALTIAAAGIAGLDNSASAPQRLDQRPATAIEVAEWERDRAGVPADLFAALMEERAR